jgi:iron(III) transport system permease protein
VFGLMLVLGDPEGNMVLATYLYKLTNKLGTPSYHLMAAVAVVLICITIPLVMLQRRLMRTANRFVTMKAKLRRHVRCRSASGAELLAGWWSSG